MRLEIVFLFIACLSWSDGGRILVWIPTPSISHQTPFRPLTQELARRGHEVVVITTDPAFPKGKAPPNLTEIDVHDVAYAEFREQFLKLPRGNKNDFLQMMELMGPLIIDVTDKELNHPEVKQLLSSKQKFDLVIVETFVRAAMILSHIFNAPMILGSSFGAFPGNLHMIGAPTHPLLYANPFRTKLNNLTVWDKLSQLYDQFRITRFFDRLQELEDNLLRKHFGPDTPSLDELANNVDMLFLNTHPIYEGNHPVPPGVIYMWGIHKHTPKELPQDLKSYLDSSKHGVIYMSFGSNTDPTLLPPATTQLFLRVLCALPYDVLFKWDADELPGRCENVRIGRWFPQPDLLQHPKIKLFITQGGLQSTDEALSAGVPLVGIPMMGDQWYNVEKYVHFKIGVKLEIETMTEESFRHAVTTVIGDESYGRNVRRLYSLMRDEPLAGLQRAVWWAEHALRHGGARHLRAPAANISWARYLELPLLAAAGAALLAALAAIATAGFFVWRALRGSAKRKVD